MRLRRLLLLSVLLILAAAAVAGILYLRSARFQETARAAILSRIEKATGMQAGMDRFAIDPFRGTFSLSRFSIRSRSETNRTFSLSIDEISGSFRLAALWRPKLELSELNIVRPQLTIAPGSGSSSWKLQSIMGRALQVAARKAAVRDGWVELNYRRIPFDLVMESLDCSIVFQPDPQSYRIVISYRNSPLQWASRRFVHDFRAQVLLLPNGVEIQSYELREHKSVFTGSGRLTDWSAPALHVSAKGTLAGDDLTLVTQDLRDARGDVRVDCGIDWDSRSYRVAGSLAADTFAYRTSLAGGLTGLFEVQAGVADFRDVRGHLGGGGFRLDGRLQLSADRPDPHTLRIAANNVMLKATSGFLDLRSMALENTADASVSVRWRRGLDDLAAEGSVNLHGLGEGEAGSEAKTALHGTAEFSYRNRSWYVKQASLSSPDTAVEVTGIDPARARVRLDSSQPEEVFRLMRGFSASVADLLQNAPDVMGISGRYHLDGEIRLDDPQALDYEGRIEVSNGRWRAYRIGSLSGTASWNGSRLRLRGMKLSQGAQSAEGELVVDVPADGRSAAVSFEGALRQISLGDLREVGIELDTGLKGLLDWSGRISYREGVLQGAAKFQVEAGGYRDQPFDLMRASLVIQGRELRITDGLIRRGSAAVTTYGTYNLDSREMRLTTRLNELPLTGIPGLQASGLEIDGRVTASGEVRGTPDRPEYQGSVDLAGLRYAGWDLGKGKATIDLRAGVLTTVFDVQSDLGAFRGDGRILTESGYPGRLTVEFRDWNVRKILAGSAPSYMNDLTTALRGTLLIEGPFADLAKVQYRGEMDGASFKIRDQELRNEGLIRFTGDNRKVVVEEARLVGEGTSLSLARDGVLPFDANAPMSLNLSGRLNLELLDRLAADVRVSGAAALAVSLTGSLRAPEVLGKATLEDARVDHEDLPYPLSALRGTVVFTRNSVALENVSGSFASGTIVLSGSIEHQDSELRDLNVQATLRRARVRYPKDFLSTIDAELNLRGSQDTQVLTGDVSVVRAEYLRDFSVLEQLIGRPSGPSVSQIVDPFLAGVRLNVTVRSRDGLYIDNELTRVQGGMNLTLQGTLAYPSVTGRVEAREGSIFFRGNRFDIIHGSADLVDRNRINPVFDIRAEADVRSYRLRLDVTGDLDHLRLNVTSDPPLSTVDILSLMTTGKSEDVPSAQIENPRRQAEMTGLSAASVLSEGLSDVIGKRVERIFGLQTFRVDPFLAGAENDLTARMTISERLSKDLSVTYSRNLSTNKEQIVVLEYDVNRNLSIVATRAEDGTYGIDFRFRKRF